MGKSNAVPRSGVTLLRGIARVGWAVASSVSRKASRSGRLRNGLSASGAARQAKGSLSRSLLCGGWRGRGRWKWNSPPACDCGYEARAMWFTPDVRRILAYSKPVDLRKSIDGLVGLVKSVLAEDPLSGSLFVFVNRRGNYVKLVSWDRTGWCLFAN